MNLFNEKNWDKQCGMAINFKSNYREQTKNEKPKKSKVDDKPNAIKDKKIKKPKRPASKNSIKILEKNKKLINQNSNNENIQQSNCIGVLKFEEKLRNNLKGSRFRFINEQLYTMEGSAAKCLFENDPEAFEAYHMGYKNQVEKWPFNPLDKIIKNVKKLPLDYVIADFGCGEGRLSQSVPHKVYSIDLISSREDIIACDMANTPLQSSSIDAVVFCLSLMGTNFSDFIIEANRVLRQNGLILIAEIASRFNGPEQFVRIMKMAGFEIVKKDLSNKLFYFFTFKKINDVNKSDKMIEYSLKPCLYKKR